MHTGIAACSPNSDLAISLVSDGIITGCCHGLACSVHNPFMLVNNVDCCHGLAVHVLLIMLYQ